jgi:hypothetical protein
VGMTTFDRGIAAGIPIGKRIIILEVLEARFGSLSVLVRESVESWPVGQLDELFIRILRAHSLDELGLEDCTPTVVVTQGDS